MFLRFIGIAGRYKSFDHVLKRCLYLSQTGMTMSSGEAVTEPQQLAEYGGWTSNISSKYLTEGNCVSIAELHVSARGSPFYVEQTFPKGARLLFERRSDTGEIVQWSPDGMNVSTSVYEYGGGAFCVGIDGDVFVSNKEGIFHLTKAAKESDAKRIFENPILASKEDVRHADLFAFREYLFAVREHHSGKDGEEPQNLLVKFNIYSGEETIMAEGADFYAEPRVSPDGKYLAWMQWNKPNMPWDNTSIWIVELARDHLMAVGEPRELLSGASYYGIQWASSAELYVVGDSTGFWNIYTVDIQKGDLLANLCPMSRDLGGPLWNLGDDRPFAVDTVDFVVNVGEDLWHRTVGDASASSETSKLRPLQCVRRAGFTVFAFLTLAREKNLLFAIASGPKRSKSLIEVDLRNDKLTVIRECRPYDELQRLNISVGELHTFESDGVSVSGYFYPPFNTSYKAPPGSAPPPVVFFAHPGPTMQTTNALDLKKQYYTSRGFAVFDINYRGSTGYGREFRNRLLGQWGVADRNDLLNGARYLIDKGLVDAEKTCITGSSAGGFLVFALLIHPQNVFKAAASVYGVTDLTGLCDDTHKFESEYTTALVAPLPDGEAVYRERSALYNLDKLRTPVIFIHGTDDRVVSYEQSERCYEALRQRGVPTAFQLFPGEGHGFRSAEAVSRTIDMTYTFFCRILGIKPSVECEVDVCNLPSGSNLSK